MSGSKPKGSGRKASSSKGQSKPLKSHEDPHQHNPKYDPDFTAKRMAEISGMIDGPSTFKGPHQFLHAAADLFEERNKIYKDNFRMVGKLMVAMFGENTPELKTEEDYNRWHLFELAIVKLSRYAVHYNEGGHADSIEDMIVYLSMVRALDEEANQK